MVRDEAAIARKRENGQAVLQGILVQAAGMSVMAPTEGGEFFRGLVGSLTED